MTTTPVKRALLSVSNKNGLVEFAKQLSDLGVELLSTGGTSQLLREAGIAHRQVDDVTGLPEMLSGRVKTLHPKIHGGILGRRDQHAEEAVKHDIPWIDLVVVNFYPFEEAIRNKPLSLAEAIEYIDIGGPTMVRAAAKNQAWVGAVVDPADYDRVMAELKAHHGLSDALRQSLAQKVFAMTSRYDAAINRYFLSQSSITPPLALELEPTSELRYGENPHQKAQAYALKHAEPGILSAKQHQGKPLSYNNILDAEAALACVSEFTDPAAVIVKHANPCGAATANTIDEAYKRAWDADSRSAFGGIVALNRSCTREIATAITSVFMEVVIAPAYEPEALTILASKPNLRVLALPVQQRQGWEMKFVSDGVLMQERDTQSIARDELKVVTRVRPSDEALETMLFAWKVVKHIKSNGILIANRNATVGIGAGQVSRIDAVNIAVSKAGEQVRDTVLASDAFFPFRDSIDQIARTGIRAIIQPGGSVRDEEVIAACDEHGISMVFTGRRCFRH